MTDFRIENPSSTLPAGTINYHLIFNGYEWVAAPDGTVFTFSISSFTQSGGDSTSQLIGSGNWLSPGDISFSAAYANGPATGAYVSHSGWVSNLTMGGAGFVGPTVATEGVDFPAAPGLTKVFTLNASKDAVSDTENITFTFNNYTFNGVSANASLTEAQVEALTATLSNSRLTSGSLTLGAGEYGYFCFPTRLGTPAGYTINGFAGGWIEVTTTLSITNSRSFEEDYSVWRTLNHSLGTITYSFT